jgi:type IV pilus assembly protein PilE
MPTFPHRRGFTLLELMIVLVVIAILAAIAFPSYTRYGYRARRTDGQKLLMSIASAQERYYALHNAYADLATIGYATGTTATSEAGYYTASVAVTAVSSLDAQAYTATATPQGSQARDSCGALTLTSTGTKGPAGTTSNGACW